MKRMFWQISLTVFLLLHTLWSLAATYGYVEKVRINPGNLVVKAKLDTGALSASLDAVAITEFVEKGQKMVRFKMPTDDGAIEVTRELIKHIRIKRRSDEKFPKGPLKPIRRPVVLMELTLGSITKTLEVNLTNRGRFNYPLLLGRKALIQFGAVVDPSQTFTATLSPGNANS